LAVNVAAILKAKGRAVATADPSDTLLMAAHRLAEHKIGALVIIDAVRNVIGIVSERDVIREISRVGPACLGEPVSSHMTRDVITCSDTDTLDRLMETMTKHKFRHIPVVTDGQLSGIVSIGDVVKHHIAEVELEASALKGYLAAG
jgi:CBS domain-containing protein